jgi:spoIIIJ-associated protein
MKDAAADTTDLAADTADVAVGTTDPAVGTTDVAADDAALVEVPLVGGDAPTHASQTRRLEEEGEVAADYLEELLDIADLDGDIDIDVDHGRAAVAIVAEDGSERWLRRLVGADGEVLDAIQELTRLAVQAKTGERSRLMLDIAGFREGRRVELTALAEEAIGRVRSHGTPVALEAMNPFERKVVHDAVAAAGLSSESDGVEPTRHVVIRLA